MNDMATHIMHFRSVSADEALLRMLSLFVKVCLASGSGSAVWLLSSLMFAESSLRHWKVHSHPRVDSEFCIVKRGALQTLVRREPFSSPSAASAKGCFSGRSCHFLSARFPTWATCSSWLGESSSRGIALSLLPQAFQPGLSISCCCRPVSVSVSLCLCVSVCL